MYPPCNAHRCVTNPSGDAGTDQTPQIERLPDARQAVVKPLHRQLKITCYRRFAQYPGADQIGEVEDYRHCDGVGYPDQRYRYGEIYPCGDCGCSGCNHLERNGNEGPEKPNGKGAGH